MKYIGYFLVIVGALNFASGIWVFFQPSKTTDEKIEHVGGQVSVLQGWIFVILGLYIVIFLDKEN